MQNARSRSVDMPDDQTIAELRDELRCSVGRRVGSDNVLTTAIPALQFFRFAECSAPTPVLYEPCLSLVLDGRKRLVLGDQTIEFGASSFLITAVNLPVMAAIIDASQSNHFLSLSLKINLDMARDIIATIDLNDSEPSQSSTGLSLGSITPELLAPLNRLVALLDKPRDMPFMSDMLQREIVYRLLTGPAGWRLRQIALQGTQSNRILRVIDWLRLNYAKPIRIEQVAEIAGMGVSTFHHHFRAITSMSPLQYQKHLRLHEARRVMLAENIDAGSVALTVGYESPTQFNREYRRLFGAPPLRDIQALRSVS